MVKKLRRWYWVARYNVMDKHPQFFASLAAAFFAAVAIYGVMQPADPNGPAQAWFWYIVAMIVAVFISLALAPKPPPPEPQQGQNPETKDGKQLSRVYGTVWIDDPAIVGWKQNKAEPIRKKSGKK